MTTQIESESAASAETRSPTRIEADPGRQRWVLLLATLVAALSVRGVYEISLALRQMRQLLAVDPAAAAVGLLRLVDLVLFGTAAALGLIALYLWIQGMRILKAGRYPLPGAKVVVTTPVVIGGAAAWRARLGFFLGALLLATAVLLSTVGRNYVRGTLVLPQKEDAVVPELFDPDGFEKPVPGKVLIDSTDPRHPSNRDDPE